MGPDSALSYEDLELEVLSESERDSVIEARASLGILGRSIPLRWKFRLSTQDGQWLIYGLSGFVPDGLLVWMVIVVSDGQGNPVPGAQVTLTVAGQQVTQPTDDSGLAVFPNVLSPVALDDISVVKEGFSQAAGKSSLSGFYSVVLQPLVTVRQFMVRTSPTSMSGAGDGSTIDVTPGDLDILVLVGWASDAAPQTFDLVLLVDGELHDSVSVQIPRGDSADPVEVPFTLALDEPRTYVVSAGGQSFVANVVQLESANHDAEVAPAPTPYLEPTPTPAPLAVPARPPASSPARVCYDVRSDDNSVQLLAIDPISGTVLRAGSTIAVTAEVQYQLDPLSEGQIQLNYVNDEGSWSVIASVQVFRGDGTLVLEGTFEVPMRSQITIFVTLHPTLEAVEAAGFDCWRPLVGQTEGLYPIEESPPSAP